MTLTSTLSGSGLRMSAPPSIRGAANALDAQAPAIRVMHVVFTLHPGGMEHGVVKLVNGLAEAGICSCICSTTPASPVMKVLLHRDVRLLELRRRPGNDPRLVWDLYRLFRRERPHVVHTHAWGTLLEGLVAARLARVPVVVHGEHGTLQLRPYQARIQRWAWGRADQLLAVSGSLAERMTASTGFTPSRIRTIRNGVDLSRFTAASRADARRALEIEPGDLVIGAAGRLVPVKDHANLIDALALMRDRGVEFRALIAGDGPLRRDLVRHITNRNLEGRIRLLGHRPDIERIFAALDVFTLPSRSEGMSNTILEAMASRVPVVATDVGGARELVEDGRTGRLVPPAAPAALAEALEDLARDAEARRRMGAAARAKAETEFSLPRMLRDYESLYVELAAGFAGKTRRP